MLDSNVCAVAVISYQATWLE